MKKIILTFVLTLIFNLTFAQIGGISASKMSTINYSTVPHRVIEFEPAFSISNYNQIWKNESKLDLLPTNNYTGSMGFRFTYGVSDNVESGFSLSVDVSELQWGLKYNFLKGDFFNASLMLGTNFQLLATNIESEIGVGTAFTLQYSENFSSDFDFHYIRNSKNIMKNNFNSFFCGIDNGIYIGDIQYVIGFNYQSFFNSSNLYLSPGVTIEPANNFLMVISFPFSIYGKNIEKDMNFGFALTISIE